MTAETIPYSLESVLKEIKDSIKSVDRKLDTFQKDVDQKLDNLEKGWLFWFLCGNEVYTDSFFSKIAIKVLPDKYFTIPYAKTITQSQEEPW